MIIHSYSSLFATPLQLCRTIILILAGHLMLKVL